MIEIQTAPPTTKIYKVSEITRKIRSLLESEFSAIWLEGEISNFKRHSSGHIYFTLKDESAQISAVFFARENAFLKFEPKDGLQVICIGRISVFDARGQYQVYVQRMEPKGQGALQLAFQQLKERLEKEGLFDPARKRAIPYYPRRLGMVTSPTGAAIQDMLKILKPRKYGIEITFCPVKVQGDGAAEEVARAIDQLNKMGNLDVMIIGRGGGSLEDLWAFNEEVVARAVYRSKIPVISAVGHEIDWTISDLVADHRAHTPTAAAEKIVMHWDELEERVRAARERMVRGVRHIIEARRETFNNLKSSYAFRQPKVYLNQMRQRVDEFLRQMNNYTKTVVEAKRQEFQNAAGRLDALSPLGVLSRGYSITLSKGKVIKNVNQVEIGQVIETKLGQGKIQSKITDKVSS